MRGVVCLAVICAGACGNDDSGGPYTRIDEIDTAYHTALCQHLALCGEFPDMATCLGANLHTTFDAQLSNAVAAFQAGKVLYDGSKMAKCLDSLAHHTCD